MAPPSSGSTDYIGRDPFSLLNSIPVSLLAGTLLGTLTGLGVGGGSLLMLWLTTAAAFSSEEARFISLSFFLPAAILSLTMRLRDHTFAPAGMMPAVLGGCIGALAGSQLRLFLDPFYLRKCFGILLLLVGARELLQKNKKGKRPQ